MQRAAVLRVSVAIKQIENEHLQNLLVFRVWIMLVRGKKKLGGRALPQIPPVATGLLYRISAVL